MIKQIIDCLKLDLKSDSERVAIARGKNKLPETFKEAFKPLKKALWRKK
jgi:DNA-binding ferritin-like protein (Dps family)